MKVTQEHNIERLNAVSAFLKEYRINSGYSQLELGECSNRHRNTIVCYETSNAHNLTLMTVFEIADALEIDINQIFHEIQ